jgi:hypothetical protein
VSWCLREGRLQEHATRCRQCELGDSGDEQTYEQRRRVDEREQGRNLARRNAVARARPCDVAGRGRCTAMSSSVLAAPGRSLPARAHGVDVPGPIDGRGATRVACVRVRALRRASSWSSTAAARADLTAACAAAARRPPATGRAAAARPPRREPHLHTRRRRRGGRRPDAAQSRSRHVALKPARGPAYPRRQQCL